MTALPSKQPTSPAAPLVAHYAAMARNNAWSNARLFNACVALDDDAFAAPRTSFFPSLRLTLNHVLLVDRYYLDALVDGGEGLTIFDDEEPWPRATDLWAAQSHTDRELIAFCDALDATALDREVRIDRGPRIGIHRETVGVVLPHLFIHQIHHRGQAHAMLSGTAIAPPQLDEYFLIADTPARDRELAALKIEPYTGH
ncbi:DinB family protein [Paraburkholderia sp.]|uniref:DinB family protein n=1 Tax=Paraburkholderia sp. TaxID=1926495 RepID=UPI003D6E3DB4